MRGIEVCYDFLHFLIIVYKDCVRYRDCLCRTSTCLLYLRVSLPSSLKLAQYPSKIYLSLAQYPSGLFHCDSSVNVACISLDQRKMAGVKRYVTRPSSKLPAAASRIRFVQRRICKQRKVRDRISACGDVKLAVAVSWQPDHTQVGQTAGGSRGQDCEM
jgi:hypothetical protein